MGVYVQNGKVLVPTIYMMQQQEKIQYNKMPQPCKKLNGKIYQYIGETIEEDDGTIYNKGFFYCCTLVAGKYMWMQLSLGEILPTNAYNIGFDSQDSELKSKNINDVILELNNNANEINDNLNLLDETIGLMIMDI